MGRMDSNTEGLLWVVVVIFFFGACAIGALKLLDSRATVASKQKSLSEKTTPKNLETNYEKVVK